MLRRRGGARGHGEPAIKQLFADTLGEKRSGMAQALARVGLELVGTHHRGIDDARNIARLLPRALGRAKVSRVSD